jgi:hypothetical protein
MARRRQQRVGVALSPGRMLQRLPSKGGERLEDNLADYLDQELQQKFK